MALVRATPAWRKSQLNPKFIPNRLKMMCGLQPLPQQLVPFQPASRCLL